MSRNPLDATSDITHDVDFIRSHEALPDRGAERLLGNVLGFLATILQGYLDANLDVPREPLATMISALRSGQSVPAPALADYVQRFDKIMLDADDTERWYDFTTQDTLLVLLSYAEARLGQGRSAGSLLSEALDPVWKITQALRDDGVQDTDFDTIEAAMRFIQHADLSARDDKVATLVKVLGDRPVHL